MMATPARPKTRTSSMCIAQASQGTHRFDFEVGIKRGAAAVGSCVTSDTFSVGGHQWRIRFYPRGTGVFTKTDTAVFLDPVNECTEDQAVEMKKKKKKKIRYDFRLLNRATGLCSSVFSGRDQFSGASKPLQFCWGTHTFMERKLLLGASYLQDGRVVIECDVTVEEEEEIVEVQVPPSDLVCDLGQLLKAEEEADVAFDVRGEVFHAHKVILVARSKVFMELLMYGSMMDKEMRTVVTVEDTEPDAFKALLHFIYTDSLPAMDDLDGDKNEETVWRLLVAAEKYAVEGMKSLCFNILCNRLDDKRVTGTLALADKYRCCKVRDACIEFMKRECPAVYIDILEKAARSDKI